VFLTPQKQTLGGREKYHLNNYVTSRNQPPEKEKELFFNCGTGGFGLVTVQTGGLLVVRTTGEVNISKPLEH